MQINSIYHRRAQFILIILSMLKINVNCVYKHLKLAKISIFKKFNHLEKLILILSIIIKTNNHRISPKNNLLIQHLVLPFLDLLPLVRI